MKRKFLTCLIVLIVIFQNGILTAGHKIIKHVTVYYEKGRFGGWPANNGIWSWGNEILVGLINGIYKAKELHHSIEKEMPMISMLASTSTALLSRWVVWEPA